MIEKFWIIWNESIERCDFPTKKHFSLTEANQEAERLARIHRDKKFSVMELVGTVGTIDIQWEFTSDIPF